ncbi:hypothetical protein [Anaerobacillus arseniciselenatis]|nr:hypothetical protein [Anaerobacillus arseniciselenatis]
MNSNTPTLDKETNIDVEICEAVTELKDDTELLTFRKIEEIQIPIGK